jgi:hypothetical protein
VEGLKVINPQLASYYTKEFLRNIFGYTVGTNFMVKAGSSKVDLKENEGIWVG